MACERRSDFSIFFNSRLATPVLVGEDEGTLDGLFFFLVEEEEEDSFLTLVDDFLAFFLIGLSKSESSESEDSSIFTLERFFDMVY